MREYAVRRGWQITVEINEIGSGALQRPKREELRAAARRRELDAILVWRLDRWGRSLPDLVVTLKELAELSIGFVSLTKACDMTTPTGRALAGMPIPAPGPDLASSGRVVSIHSNLNPEIAFEHMPGQFYFRGGWANNCPPAIDYSFFLPLIFRYATRTTRTLV